MTVCPDLRHHTRALLALLVALIRYLTTVAPTVRGELQRWQDRARAIEDPAVRGLALEKLESEGFNAQAGAMLATFAPRRSRGDVTRAVVALEVLFDFLDGLSEHPNAEPIGDGEQLFAVYLDALTMRLGSPGGPASTADVDEHTSYTTALADTARNAMTRLPATDAVLDCARIAATRSARAQIHMHATPALGKGQLEAWARQQAAHVDLEWRALLAGSASSVLVVHALIAAAADPHTTPAAAQQIANIYLRICVVLTLLDGLVDRQHDRAIQPHGYSTLFDGPGELADALVAATHHAVDAPRALADAPRHLMILAGVVAYYATAPGAEDPAACAIFARLRTELGPLGSAAVAVMRFWRLAQRVR